jgi:hypothetical protein
MFTTIVKGLLRDPQFVLLAIALIAILVIKAF